jgi:beta-barrel assembly-enhancing protease
VKIHGRLIDDSAPPLQVSLVREGPRLVIQTNDGKEAGRWPLNCISFKKMENGLIHLENPPNPMFLEISAKDFRKAPWSHEIPGYEARLAPPAAVIAVAVCVVVCLGLIFGVPYLAAQVPFSVEHDLFEKYDPVTDANKCTGEKKARATKALQKLVARIYPLGEADRKFTIDVHVARNKEVNAFALPGGRIYLNEGLLQQAQSGDEVAGVLAHEISHVKERHVIKSAADKLLMILFFPDFAKVTSLVNLKFSKNQEAAADNGAIERLHSAKVSSAGLKNFFERMQKEPQMPTLLSDHPAMAERSENIHVDPSEKTTAVITSQEWAALKSICDK